MLGKRNFSTSSRHSWPEAFSAMALAAALTWSVPTAAANLQNGRAYDLPERTYLEMAVKQSVSFRDRYEAEAWYQAMSDRIDQWMPDPRTRFDLLRLVHYHAKMKNLPPEVVLAVIYVESRFRKGAVSSATAQGYMQVMPFWTRSGEMSGSTSYHNLQDMETNIRYGCAILEWYLRAEKGNWTRALARYNGSLGKTWYPALVMDALKNRILVSPQARQEVLAQMDTASFKY